MAKSSRISTKSAKKVAKATSRSAGRASRSRAPARPARAGKSSRTTAKNGKPVLAKSSKKPRGRGKSRAIEVKVGSVGGGLPFLAGKPGSTGASGPLDDSHPKLTRTKLTSRDLAQFRELLLAKRRQLLGDMETMENEALRSETSNLSHLPVHMADMGTDNYEQEFTLSLVDRERKLVDEIDRALAKIDDKSYGICEGTGQMISRERLEAQPWARYSIEYARHLQRPGVRR